MAKVSTITRTRSVQHYLLFGLASWCGVTTSSTDLTLYCNAQGARARTTWGIVSGVFTDDKAINLAYSFKTCFKFFLLYITKDWVYDIDKG
jgi:hypothetical protein